MSKLRAIREKHNYTQQLLADELGVCVTSVNLWEGGHSCPRLSNIQRLQDLFGKDSISKADFTR